jgi:hypothetical protein
VLDVTGGVLRALLQATRIFPFLVDLNNASRLFQGMARHEVVKQRLILAPPAPFKPLNSTTRAQTRSNLKAWILP